MGKEGEGCLAPCQGIRQGALLDLMDTRGRMVIGGSWIPRGWRAFFLESQGSRQPNGDWRQLRGRLRCEGLGLRQLDAWSLRSLMGRNYADRSGFTSSPCRQIRDDDRAKSRASAATLYECSTIRLDLTTVCLTRLRMAATTSLPMS